MLRPCIQRHSGRTGNRPYAGNLLQETFAEALAASERFKVFSRLDPNLAAALRTPPDRQRVVVHLADIEGLGYRQISVHTGIPLGRVKSSLHRAGADYAPDWAVMRPGAWAACLDQRLAQ
jgi:DNA-directed RNA polymerase specialized sigma24 family protein